MIDHEQVRRRFLPSEVRLLMIGESPPAGGSFFYTGDCGLLHYTREGFSAVYEECSAQSSSDFLAFFKRQGCYLEDLCHYPIDHLNRRERRAAHRREVQSLAVRISSLRPHSIVCFLKDIEPFVRKAVASAGLTEVPFSALPFPGMSHQGRYVRGLAAFLDQLVASGVLPPRRAA